MRLWNLLLLGALSGLWIANGCSSRTNGEECYPSDPLDPAEIGEINYIRAHCQWGWTEPFPREPPYDLGPTSITLCQPPDEAGECIFCPAEDVDEIFMDHFEAHCGDVPIVKFKRGCVTTPDKVPSGECCYRAFYWSECRPVIE